MNRVLAHRSAARLLGVLAAACAFALALGAAARAQDITAQTLIDRAEIQDLLTRYSYNLGHGSPESFAAFYAEDAQLILGARTYTGREEIAGAYAAIPQDGPTRTAFSFNVLIGNPLIVVNGDTATAKLVFTEIIIDEQGDAPRILAQGREYDTLVKRDGQWLIKSRQIVSGRGDPEGWTD